MSTKINIRMNKIKWRINKKLLMEQIKLIDNGNNSAKDYKVLNQIMSDMTIKNKNKNERSKKNK